MLRVLYVDDEPDLLDIGKIFLETSPGFLVDTLTSAADALAALPKKQYDAIVSDYQMPGMDGIAFLKAVRASGNTIQFILFTGRGREEIVIQALNEGADFYLQKGGEPKSQFAELSHKVRQAVQQRRAEISIRDHERREADIINFLPDATFAIDREGTVIAWNRAIEEMTGVQAAEMLGKGNYEYAIPFYGTRRKILIDRIFEPDNLIALNYSHIIHEKGSLIADTTLSRPQGRSVTLMGKASPLYDREGNIVGAIESIRDITERKRVEDELRKSEIFTRALLDAVPTPVFYKDREGKYLGCNRAFTEITGIKPEDIAGKTVFDLFPKDLARAYHQKDMELIQHPEHQVCEYKIRDREGMIRPVIYASDVFNDESGNVAGIIGAFLDISERVSAETALRESEERFRTIFDTAQVGMVIIDPVTHGILQVNKKALDLIGAAEEDVTGRGCHAFICPSEAGRCPVTDLGESVESSERVLVKRDGSILPVLKTVISTHLGSQPVLLESFVDLSERKQIENAFQESEERYRTVVEGQTEFISRFRPDGTHVFVNEAYCRYFGMKRDEILGHRFRPEIPAEDRESVKKFFESLTKDHPIAEIRHRIIMPDGDVRWQRWSDRAIFDDDGTLKEYQSVGRDITDIRQAEEALRESEELFRKLVNTVPDIVIHTDLNGTILYANEKVFELGGYTSDGEMIGTPIFRYIAPEDLPRALENSRLMIERQLGPVEYALISRDGARHVLEINGSVLRTPDGSPYGMVFVGRDVTQRKKTEEAIRNAQRKLTLLSSMTRHDIQNKVTVQLGLLALAHQKTKGCPEISAYLEKLDATVQAIRDQIGFMQVYQNLGSNDPRWQDIYRTLAKTPVPPYMSVTDECAGTEIFADVMLEKVFGNLIDNTLRHGGNVTRITLTMKEADGNLVVRYEDNGVGVPENEKEKIFERGFGKNTGLGLFLAREVLAITGITIKETGIPGEGACFEITVPHGEYRFSRHKE